VIDDRFEDVEDDECGEDQKIDEIEQEPVKVKLLAGARKSRPWASVEEYMEERRLKMALSEDNYDYDI